MSYYLELAYNNVNTIPDVYDAPEQRIICKVPLVIFRNIELKEIEHELLSGTIEKDVLGFRNAIKIYFYPSTFDSQQKPYNNYLKFRDFFAEFFIAKHIWAVAGKYVSKIDDNIHRVTPLTTRGFQYFDPTVSRYLVKSLFAEQSIDFNITTAIDDGIILKSTKILTAWNTI